MSTVEALAKQLTEQGEKNVEVRGNQLFINGRYVPFTDGGDEPYMSDCPNGKCNI